MKTIKIVAGLILRFGLLVLGIALTFIYYSNTGVDDGVSALGFIFILVGLLVASRSSMLGFGQNLSSINGIGTTLYGKREVESDGSYIATKWFIFFLLPIFPMSSYRVLPNVPKMNFITQVTNYSRFEKVPLSKKQVINTYLLIYRFIFIIFMLPFLL